MTRLIRMLCFAAVTVCLAPLLVMTASASDAPRTDRAAAMNFHHAARVHNARVRHARLVHTRDLHRASLVRAWAHISDCENGPGAWNPPRGPVFPNSLGITAANWFANGGGTDLRPFVQAMVAFRIQNPPPPTCPW
jgi:hypothetical protein